MHKLTLNLPDNIYHPLVQKARRTGRTPEEVATDYVATAVAPAEDPLLQLLGSLEADTSDVSLRHDDYIGQGLTGESHARG